MNRIEEKFKALKKNKKKAFIAFVTCGYPDLKTTYDLVLEFSRIGVDIVELGVPFSDPIADGPVIQESSFEALKKKINLLSIMNMVKSLRKKTDIPICIMSYYNPILCLGEAKFTKYASSCGIDGIIIPDLPPEEAGNLMKLSKVSNLDTIFFVSPTTSLERTKKVSRLTSGFIYYVSLTGVTGERKAIAEGLSPRIKMIKKITKKPVCVGFGISNASQVKEIMRFADGVIVGSAIVKKIKENLNKKNLVKNVSGFVSKLLVNKNV